MRRIVLGSILKEIVEKTTVNNQHPVLTSSQNGLVSQDEYFNKQIASQDNTGYKIIRKGQFTYRAMSDTGRFYINQSSYDIGIVSPAYPVFEITNTNIVLPEYIAMYFKSESFQNAIALQSTGSTRVSLKLNKIKDLEIFLPDVAQQGEMLRNIAEAESLILARREQLAKLDELVKSRFIELFDGYAETTKLSEVAVVTGGLTKNSKRDQLPLRMPYLRVANVAFASIDVTEMLDIGLTRDEYEKTLLEYEDMLFVEGNGSPDQIGRVAIWRNEITPCVHQNHLIKARFNQGVVKPVFAMHYFMSQSGREQIKSKAVSTSGLFTLSVSKVADLLMPVPPMDKQADFVAFVEQTDKSKLAIQESLAELETLKKALMQKYFG